MSSAQALKAVTDVKHAQLDENFEIFNSFYQNLLESIEGKPPSKQLDILLEKCSKPSSSFDISSLIKRIEALNIFSQGTAFSSDTKVKAWCQEIIDSLNIESEKYKYTRLFYKLILGAVQENAKPQEKKGDFKAEMAEQRAQFEQFVFSESTGDAAAIKSYLNDELFGEYSHQLEKLRNQITTFCNSFANLSISVPDVISTIKNLIVTGLVNNDNIKVLRGFLDNTVVIKEIADVMTVKLKSFSSWNWPKEGLKAEQKRQLNGKYRVYAHSDLIDTIFLHYLGVTWTVQLRKVLVQVTKSKAWKLNYTKKSNDRKKFYFGSAVRAVTPIDKARYKVQHEKFLLTQLAKSREGGQASGYCESDDETDDNVPASDKVNIGELRQELLRILVTELELSKAMKRPHTIVRSDFKWFGPSLSHVTILSVMEFFGATEEWLEFFRKFLAIPIKFADNENVRVRTRGTPMSYAFSDLFGESILFLLDFAVNQYGEGLFLYRLHDDFWLWHHDQSLVAKVWKQMNRFNEIFGLEFNEEKTGSKTIGGDPHDEDLPRGNGVKWGFLELTDSGKLMIDQKNVDEHIEELRRQLSGTNDVLNWIKAYNSYVKFLVNNFGDLSPNLSYYHLDDIVDTLTRVNTELFNEYSPVSYLSKVLEERYGATDLVQGWFYQPVEAGGLGLCDVRIFLQLMKTQKTLKDKEDRRNGIKPKPSLFVKAAEADRKLYDDLREAFFRERDHRSIEKFSVQKEDYPSFEFFLSCRENWISTWQIAYSGSSSLALTNNYVLPRTRKPNAAGDQANHCRGSATQLSEFNVEKQRSTIETLYGDEMWEKWATKEYTPIFSQFKPLGLVQAWKKERTEWMK
ncbi:hypothetical protein D0Z00_003287 [Geotrichum galactomycetum]|uniref:Uncharacterized protein n=1 Tax=Geotrichum galactomycetum TaxID=27317 RepID=A0ACB6V1M9_9ASCO|nr:hypothetical protein D0Z00_003287 [Geotrichum candidum]